MSILNKISFRTDKPIYNRNGDLLTYRCGTVRNLEMYRAESGEYDQVGTQQAIVLDNRIIPRELVSNTITIKFPDDQIVTFRSDSLLPKVIYFGRLTNTSDVTRSTECSLV